MPHIIVEYPEQSIDVDKIERMLTAIHHAVANSCLFEVSHIKTRAYPFRSYTNAGAKKSYLHIQARIKSGRDADNKKRLSDAILAAVVEEKLEVEVSTVEIIDMDRDSYGKVIR